MAEEMFSHASEWLMGSVDTISISLSFVIGWLVSQSGRHLANELEYHRWGFYPAISVAVVTSFLPSHMVLNCSGIGISVWKKKGGHNTIKFHHHLTHVFLHYFSYSSQFTPSLTKSPFLPGTSTFISELLALMISHDSESWLRYTWQPSVLLMEMVGTLPKTCIYRRHSNMQQGQQVCLNVNGMQGYHV